MRGTLLRLQSLQGKEVLSVSIILELFWAASWAVSLVIGKVSPTTS